MVASIIPNGESQYIDGNGRPYALGSVTYYIPATTTPKLTWQDAAQTVPNTSPTITLDAAGRCVAFGSGSYRQILKDSLGNTIWDIVINDPLSDATAALIAAWSAIAAAPGPAARGGKLSNNAGDPNNDIDNTACKVMSDDGLYLISVGALTKRLDANWVVGTNQGGLDTGAEAASTSYAVFAIARTDTNVADILFSASFTAPTMPASYTKKCLIGAIINNAASNIRAFTQIGNEFWLMDSLPTDLTDATITSGVWETGVIVAPPLSVITGLFNLTDAIGVANISEVAYLRATGTSMAAASGKASAGTIVVTGAQPGGGAAQFTLPLNAGKQLDYTANQNGAQVPTIVITMTSFRLPQLVQGGYS